jgi:hypothetical protein
MAFAAVLSTNVRFGYPTRVAPRAQRTLTLLVAAGENPMTREQHGSCSLTVQMPLQLLARSY